MTSPVLLIPVNYPSCPPQTCIITWHSLSIRQLLPSLLSMILPPSHLYTVLYVDTHTHSSSFFLSVLDDPFPKRQGWMGLLSISTSSTVFTLPHSFSSDTHTPTYNLSLSHTHTLFERTKCTQVCKMTHTHTHTFSLYTHHTVTSLYTPCHQLHTKAYQYGRFSSHWGVQASLTSQHNKTISSSLMK